MDISGKLSQIRKLLEVQTFQKSDSRDTLINLLREVYFAYMFYRIEENNKTAKCKREQQSLLRLLLVHVDSENHTNNGEKILMINLIKIIEKKANRLFSYYPNIWKGNNSFFFFYISKQNDDPQMTKNAFNILQHSNSVYKNIYISLLLFHSNHFEIKIKTVKYIFYKYILNLENGNLCDDYTSIKFEDICKTDFLKKEKNSKDCASNIITSFFFSIIDNLIKYDYITLLNQNQIKKDEEILRQLLKSENDSFKENKSTQTYKEYRQNVISYILKKNIFHKYFNFNESTILAREFDTNSLSRYCLNLENENENEEREINMDDIDMSTENDDSDEEKKEQEQEEQEEQEQEEQEEQEQDNSEKQRKSILRKENLYYDSIKNEIVINEIKDHYNETFLKSLFFYVKNITHYCKTLLSIDLKKNVTEIKKNYLICCSIQCTSILFNICCFNQQLVQDSLLLINEMKENFINYLDSSIILSMAQFVLFFSSDKDFENIANLMFTYFSKEYKNYLVSFTFFDFIIKNANILKKQTFFFRKFYSIILKVYFYFYRTLKNALIYLFPYLVYEGNYGIFLCQLLSVPYTPEITSTCSSNSSSSSSSSSSSNSSHQIKTRTIFNGGKQYLLLTGEEEAFDFSMSTNYEELRVEIKNEKRLNDIRDNLHRYIKVYFDSLVSNEIDREEEKGNNSSNSSTISSTISSSDSSSNSIGSNSSSSSSSSSTIISNSSSSWLIEIAKIVLHKLKCLVSYETMSKESVKEILKGLKHIVYKNKNILLLFQEDILNLLKKNSEISVLINRKLLDIIGDNIRYLNIGFKEIEQYYFTIHLFFTFSKFYDLKFWTALLYAFTNIAIACYDLSAAVLETYRSLLSQNNVPLILKNIIIDNITIITNFSYINDT